MVFPTRRRTRVGRKMRRAPRRRRYGLYKTVSRLPQQFKYCETFNMGTLIAGPGGSGYAYTVKFNDIPQSQNYSNLFNQFAIRKLQVILIPRYNSNDINTAIAGLGYGLPQICYSIQDTPAVNVPANQQQVLTDNGAKISVLSKKIVMTCYPKPYVSMRANRDGQTDQNVAVRTKKLIWFNTTGPDVQSNGVSVPHGTIALWVTNQFAGGGPQDVADVYYKVWFSMRDPA